jgi:hypothetical protein
MADNEREIIVRVENTIVGGNGQQGAPGQPLPSTEVQPSSANQNANNAFAQGISAHLLATSLTRILAATGNTEAASVVREATSYGFLAARLIGSGGYDIAAWMTLATKATADIMQAVQQAKQQQIELAQQQNATDLIRMRSGLISINANTQISYNRYGRHSFTDRK